jgi:hypothetical protein
MNLLRPKREVKDDTISAKLGISFVSSTFFELSDPRTLFVSALAASLLLRFALAR